MTIERILISTISNQSNGSIDLEYSTYCVEYASIAMCENAKALPFLMFSRMKKKRLQYI